MIIFIKVMNYNAIDSSGPETFLQSPFFIL